tara:strand:+ start:165 stop:1085 length:921 start_codon:yes stop_codon:yes gene_type:complete
MRPTLRQLEYLVTISELGTFNAAATQLGVSQPALSSQIKEMEYSLRTRLFERRKAGAQLTKTGEIICDRARKVLRDVRDIQNIALRDLDAFSGKLNIAVLPSIGAYFLPNVVKELHHSFPELRLIIREFDTDTIEDNLLNNDLDLVIATPLQKNGIVDEALFKESLWICSAVDDPIMATREPVFLSDLEHRELISPSTKTELGRKIRIIGNMANATVSQEYTAIGLDASRQMSIMGAGIAVLPSLYALTEAVRDPDFRVRKIDHPIANIQISISWRSSSPFQDSYVKLAKIFREVYAEMDLSESFD